MVKLIKLKTKACLYEDLNLANENQFNKLIVKQSV